MLEKHTTFAAICDFCPNDLDTEETDFISAVDAMKKGGWRIFKTGTEWNHMCRSCQAEEENKDFDVV